jgi:hypothetical protein
VTLWTAFRSTEKLTYLLDLFAPTLLQQPLFPGQPTHKKETRKKTEQCQQSMMKQQNNRLNEAGIRNATKSLF